MNYYTSDWHINHKRMMDTDPRTGEPLRPYKNLEIMKKELFDNIVSTVKKDDTLYVLGDGTLQSNKNNAELYGFIVDLHNAGITDIVWVYGNHDDIAFLNRLKNEFLIRQIYPFRTVKDTIFGKEVCVFLSHHPVFDYHNAGGPVMNIHGHCHGYMNQILPPDAYDCGVDCNNYKPVTAEELVKSHGYTDLIHMNANTAQFGRDYVRFITEWRKKNEEWRI